MTGDLFDPIIRKGNSIAPVSPHFPDPVARKKDLETSHKAAAAAKMSASIGRILALRELAKGPRTDFELASATGWQQTSIGKRRGECVAAGLAEKAGFTRPAPSGAAATVWRITPAGLDYLRGSR